MKILPTEPRAKLAAILVQLYIVLISTLFVMADTAGRFIILVINTIIIAIAAAAAVVDYLDHRGRRY